MAAKATNQIKIEGADAPENVTEIQSYLEGFQKEIEGSDATNQQTSGKHSVHLFSDISK